MNAADIMTKPVNSVAPEAMIAEAARLMLQHRISGLPVTGKGGAVVAIVTEADLLRRAELRTERHRPRWPQKAQHVVSRAGCANRYYCPTTSKHSLDLRTV